LTSAFDKFAGTEKIAGNSFFAGNAFFLLSKAFFAGSSPEGWRLASIWKLYFQIRAHCALTSAFNKVAMQAQKNCRQTLFFAVKSFFLQANAFFQATLFIKKKG
jgi:hypothetical protein